MNSKMVIGLIALIFVIVFACAGPEQLSEQDLVANPNEPWTGIWNSKLSSGFEISNVLKLKQNGNVVKSAKGCAYGIEGKVSGNQLKATYKGGHNIVRRLNLVMSDDLKSFEGEEIVDAQNTYTLTGVRKE